ncbi:hypothetical protein U1Q18_019250 [Sarracenia purpurea var. burkii]
MSKSPPMAEETPPPQSDHSKMTEDHKHAGKRKDSISRYAPRDVRRACCGCVVVLLLLAGITVLTVWLVYRPHKPRFTVVGVAVYNLSNTFPPPFVSATMQFVIVTRNPSRRVSILYDHLSAFVLYHDQMITQTVMLPPLFQEKHSTVQLAPILGGGGAVPVSPAASYGLGMDEAYGVVGLTLILLGKLRWKAGAITTAHYGIYVGCDVLLRLSQGCVGEVPFVAPPVCKVHI